VSGEEDFAIAELEDAKETLYAAALELMAARTSDPAIPQLDALARGVDQVIGVLKARRARRRRPG
jgi:hypothetical protein